MRWWVGIRDNSEQTQVFQGYDLPESLPEYISEKISGLSVLVFWEYALLWIMMFPGVLRYKRRLGKEQVVSYLLRKIADEARCAEGVDEPDGYKVSFKLAMEYEPEAYCAFLTSFRHLEAPPGYGWLQRDYVVARMGKDAYTVFYPKQD